MNEKPKLTSQGYEFQSSSGKVTSTSWKPPEWRDFQINTISTYVKPPITSKFTQ